MIKIVRAQWYQVIRKKGFWIAFWCFLLLSAGYFLIQLYENKGQDVYVMSKACNYFALMDIGVIGQYFNILFPILIAFPVALLSFDENIGKTGIYSEIRCSSYQFYFAKLIVSFFASFFVVAIPFLFNWIWITCTFPASTQTYEGTLNSAMYFGDSGYDFEVFYKLHPYLYELLFIVQLSIFAGICSMLAYSIGCYVKKYKIFIVLPIYIVYFVSNEIGIPHFSMDDYLQCPWEKGSVGGMLQMEVVFLIVAIVLCVKFATSKKEIQ